MRIIHVIGPAVGRPQIQHPAGAPAASARRHPSGSTGAPVAERGEAASANLRGASVELSPAAMEAARQAASDSGDRAARSLLPAVEAPGPLDPSPGASLPSWPTEPGVASVSDGPPPDDEPAPEAEAHEHVSESAAVNAAALTYELRADGYLYAVARNPDHSAHGAAERADDASPGQGDDHGSAAAAAASAWGRQVLSRLTAGRR